MARNFIIIIMSLAYLGILYIVVVSGSSFLNFEIFTSIFFSPAPWAQMLRVSGYAPYEI
eukprot:SAG11_NODE_1216_length_5501_cov_2.800629_1_plen_59_part_00